MLQNILSLNLYRYTWCHYGQFWGRRYKWSFTFSSDERFYNRDNECHCCVCVRGKECCLDFIECSTNRTYSSFYIVYRFKVLQLQISTSLTCQEDFAYAHHTESQVLFTSSANLFIPKSVFYTQSLMLNSLHLIPQSVFYTHSAVRSTHPYVRLTA